MVVWFADIDGNEFFPSLLLCHSIPLSFRLGVVTEDLNIVVDPKQPLESVEI